MKPINWRNMNVLREAPVFNILIHRNKYFFWIFANRMSYNDMFILKNFVTFILGSTKKLGSFAFLQLNKHFSGLLLLIRSWKKNGAYFNVQFFKCLIYHVKHFRRSTCKSLSVTVFLTITLNRKQKFIFVWSIWCLRKACNLILEIIRQILGLTVWFFFLYVL